MARRYGISAETVRKRRKRGVTDCLDRSARPHQLPWKASEEERAIVRSPTATASGAFSKPKACQELGQLARLRPWLHPHRHQAPAEIADFECERRKRFLFVAIDRCSRSAHLAVKDDETEKSAIAFRRQAAAAFPFHLTHVLTDNGSCFTPAFARACVTLGAECRHTKPRTPQTNGIVERFDGRIASEVLGINVCSHRALEQFLRGFSTAYNARWQRVLNGKTLNQVVAERLQVQPRRANLCHGAGQAPATSRRLASSLKPQRRSHNQTARRIDTNSYANKP